MVSAVPRYSLFSYSLAVIINLCLGAPLVSYYDDIGASAPSEIAQEDLVALTECSHIPMSELGDGISAQCDTPELLVLTGVVPKVAIWVAIRLILPQDKVELCAIHIGAFIICGRIQHKQLVEIIGALSFAKTPIFCRFGRTIIRPLYKRMRAHPLRELIAEDEAGILGSRAASLRAARPRPIWLTSDLPHLVIYTDAAAATMILAAVVFEVATFLQDLRFSSTIADVAGGVGNLFSPKRPLYVASK